MPPKTTRSPESLELQLRAFALSATTSGYANPAPRAQIFTGEGKPPRARLALFTDPPRDQAITDRYQV